MLRSVVQRTIVSRPLVSIQAVRFNSTNIPDAGGAYKEREQTAEKQWALKRDQELLAKLRAKLHEEESKAIAKHGEDAIQASVPPPFPEFRHDPAGGSFITLNEFLEFRKEILNKLREVEDEVIALKYKKKF